MNNLAGLYKAQRRYEEAEPLYLQSLESKERIYEKEHPSVLFTRKRLIEYFPG